MWLVEFNFLKTSTYLHEICQLFMIHLQFASVNFWAKITSKVKIVEKYLTFPNKADNFTNKVKFLTPANIYVESQLVKENFPAIGRNPTRGVSQRRVARFSNLDFSMGFLNFFKFSPKMLHLGPNYSKKLRLFVIYNFLTHP